MYKIVLYLYCKKHNNTVLCIQETMDNHLYKADVKICSKGTSQAIKVLKIK